MNLKGYEQIRSVLDGIMISPKPRVIEGLSEDVRFVAVEGMVDTNYEDHPEAILNTLDEKGFMRREGLSDAFGKRGPKFIVTAVVGDKVILEDTNLSWF